MNRNYYLIIVIGIIITAILETYFSKNLSVVYLILTLTFLSFETISYIINRNKLKAKTNFKIGKRKEAVWYSIFFITIGLYFLWSSYENMSHSSQYGLKVWMSIFLATVLISNAFFSYENFKIYLKDESIVFYDFKNKKEWKISAVDKVILNNNVIIIIREGYKKKYYFSMNINEFQAVKEYFTTRLQDRLEFNEQIFSK